VQPPCVAFREANAVFSGPVTDIEKAPRQQGDTFDYLLIHFSIEQSYKGAPGTRIMVDTITGTSCDFGFQIGERYFVYAYQDSKYKRLAAGVCSRTKSLSYAQEDIDYARGLADSKPKAMILGTDDPVSSRLQGAEIILEGQGAKYTTVADKKGAFKVELAQPGRYKITVIGQEGYEFLNLYDSWNVISVNGRPAVEIVLNVADGDCGFVDFSQYLTVREKKR
jgi:hypothetical protein